MGAVAFNKFDPYREEPEQDGLKASSGGARRRALLLKYGWWLSTAYVVLGFGFILYWILIK